MDKQTLSISNLKELNKSNSSSECSKRKTDYKVIINKFLNKKNLKILILIIVGIIALILLMGVGNKEEVAKNQSVNSDNSYVTTLQYCRELEGKLENLLSQVSGAGNVKVMISVEGSPELVYATSDDNKTSSSSSGSTVTSSSNPIIVESNGSANPLILTENLPDVKGVIVVSSGAKDIAIKLDILNAVSTLLNISTDKISVLKGI